MSILWMYCRRHYKEMSRQRTMFLFLNVLLWGTAGLIVWLVVSRWILNDLGSALVFIGYPACIIGFFGGIVYLYRVSH